MLAQVFPWSIGQKLLKQLCFILLCVLHLFSPLKCVTVIPCYTALTHYCMKCILFLLSLHISNCSWHTVSLQFNNTNNVYIQLFLCYLFVTPQNITTGILSRSIQTQHKTKAVNTLLVSEFKGRVSLLTSVSIRICDMSTGIHQSLH